MTPNTETIYTMNYLIKLFITMGICLSGTVFGDTAVSLVFKDSILVNDTVFTVGDICGITCANKLIHEQLQKTVAGVCAPPGYARFVNVSDLVNYRLKPVFTTLDFEVGGVQRVVVQTDFTEKKIGDYLEDINDYFKRTVSWPESCWNLKVENVDQTWKCLKAPVVVEISGAQEPFPKGHQSVTLSVKQGMHHFSVPVVCDISVVIPVVISTKEIQRGEMITIDDCELKTMDITRFGPLPFKDLESVRGNRAARTITAGTIIHNRLVTAIPLIEKNEQVQILLQRGRVKVAVQGIAREAGGKDEHIWVENAVSHKLIRATVVEKGTVIVYQGGTSI